MLRPLLCKERKTSPDQHEKGVGLLPQKGIKLNVRFILLFGK